MMDANLLDWEIDFADSISISCIPPAPPDTGSTNNHPGTYTETSVLLRVLHASAFLHTRHLET